MNQSQSDIEWVKWPVGILAMVLWLAGASVFGVSGTFLMDCIWEDCGPPIAGVWTLFAAIGVPGVLVGMAAFVGVARWQFGLSDWRGPVILVTGAAFMGGLVVGIPESVPRPVGMGLFVAGGLAHLAGGIVVIWMSLWQTVLGD